MNGNEIENTLKKMGLVLEKVVQKVDELDKRVKVLEEKVNKEKNFSSQDFQKTSSQTQTSSSVNSGGFGSSFLGSLAGSMAGMGLYNLLFNHSVSPVEFGREVGLNDEEIDGVLQNDLQNIDNQLEEIDTKLDELDDKVSQLQQDDDIMKDDYFESYEDETPDDAFDSGFDDNLSDFGDDFL